MKSQRSSSKSGLFLMELIIAIAFFSVASAICIQLFAKAHSLSALSASTGEAVGLARNAAETFKASDGTPIHTAELMGTFADGDSIVLYYNRDWQPAGMEESRFVLTMRFSDDQPATATITVTDRRSEQALHRLSVSKYTG